MEADFWVLFLLFMVCVRSWQPGPTLVPGLLFSEIKLKLSYNRNMLNSPGQQVKLFNLKVTIKNKFPDLRTASDSPGDINDQNYPVWDTEKSSIMDQKAAGLARSGSSHRYSKFISTNLRVRISTSSGRR